jgi:PAS domain S-box-containing protein
MVDPTWLIPLLLWAAFAVAIELWRAMRRRMPGRRAIHLLPLIVLAMALRASVVHWGGTTLWQAWAIEFWVYDIAVGALLLGCLLLARWGMRSADRLNRSLTESERLYRTIFETTGTAIMIIGEDDMVELANYEFERLSGYSKHEIENIKSWTVFFGGEMLTQLVEDHKLRRQYSYAVPRRYEAYFIDKLHNRREVFITIGMIPGSRRAVFSLLDMTEQKQTLHALRSAEMRYRGIFENAIEGIFQTTPDGRYLHANPTLARIYGYDTPEELIHQLTDIKTQLYVESSRRDEFIRELRVNGEVHNFESQIFRRNGEVIWIAENARAVYSDAGELCYFEGMVEDITEQKMNELALQAQYQLLQKTIDELETAQSTLVEQERLRALGQMASGIAHDFNNTLSPILGFTELLLKRPANLDNKEKVKRYLEMIHTAAKDASNVVRCLREFYRLRNDQEFGAPIDINTVIQESIQLTQPRWKNQAQASGVNIHVVTELQAVPAIFAVESSLREALTNLIFNAIDAMQHGGTLTLASRALEAHVIVEVRDTGVGMDSETRKRCFEPFYTTKGSRGTGLGLAMVYGVINRHGGTIESESEVGRGTTIRLKLPIRERSRRVDEIPEAAAMPTALRVLAVEDDPLVREVIKEYLTGDGYTVTLAANGREGMDLYQTGTYDLVITDRSMPEGSGDQVAAALRQRDASLPIIMLTGFGDMMEAVGEMPVGVDVILSKPLTLDALRQSIQQVLGCHVQPL